MFLSDNTCEDALTAEKGVSISPKVTLIGFGTLNRCGLTMTNRRDCALQDIASLRQRLSSKNPSYYNKLIRNTDTKMHYSNNPLKLTVGSWFAEATKQFQLKPRHVAYPLQLKFRELRVLVIWNGNNQSLSYHEVAGSSKSITS